MTGTRVKIEWLAGGGPTDPAANLTLAGEIIGRLYHEGIGWTIYVRGKRAGGYALVNQIRRDAKRMWEAKS